MKTKALFIILLLALEAAFTSYAADPTEGLKFINALDLKITGRGFTPGQLVDPYNRIPLMYKDSVVSGLWHNIECSAGMAVRFSSDSKRIGARYCLKRNNHMNHMSDCGIKGADLYILGAKGKWEFVNSIRPADDTLQNGQFVKNLDGKMHEYMIYLPLYDGIRWFEVGIEPEASTGMPAVDNPSSERGKIVWYGTSILQGGCASRTGMASTNIIQRELGIECVNIATSGQGKMYFPMARALASIENVAAYVVDPVPNCTEMQCDTLTYRFVKILRDSHPDTPIIMVEGPMYPYWKHDSYYKEYLPKKNAAFRRNYEKLRKENPRNLYYVDCEGLYAADDEGTVDGVHTTDLGFRAYADKVGKALRRALKSGR